MLDRHPECDRCPFCGSFPFIKKHRFLLNPLQYSVKCLGLIKCPNGSFDSCHAQTAKFLFISYAIAAWNTRYANK